MISAARLFQPVQFVKQTLPVTRPVRFGGEADTVRPLLGERYIEAMAYAARAHQHQLRKGTEIPYVSHLQAVASLVLENGGTEDEAMAAWLHDVVEDQGGWRRLQEIRKRFGDSVADIVVGCSDAFTQPDQPLPRRLVTWFQHNMKTQGLVKTVVGFFKEIVGFIKAIPSGQFDVLFESEKPNWTQRKQAYIQHIQHSTSSSLLVSSSDKLHNARCLLQDCRTQGDAVWDKFKGGKLGTLWYYDAILKAYKERHYKTTITEELNRVITELKRLAKVSDTELAPPGAD